MVLSVLGRWENETGFRDYLAKHLEALEPGLTLVDVEHSLPNAVGSGGRVDILATDALQNYVCIEVKRSDNSARATLNELSKYLTLFCQEYDVQKERVRCILVSTHWHEALLPLSTFAEICGADVSGYKAAIKKGEVCFERQELKQITFSPQISPEVCVKYFEDEPARNKYLSRVKERAAKLPFIRIALLCLNPIPGSKYVDHVIIAYIWKIPCEFYLDLEQVIGEKIGWLQPYAHPDAKAETDATYWILNKGDNLSTYYSSSAEFGTPEKVTNLLKKFEFDSIKKVGRWSTQDLINTDEKLLSQMVSFSPMQGGAKQNNYQYAAIAKPQNKMGFAREVSDFLDFLSFSEVFRSAAKDFLESQRSSKVEVVFTANRGRNAFMDLYLSIRRGNSHLGSFSIIVSVDGTPISGLAGGYFWDGKTFPQDAKSNMEAAFGSTFFAVSQAFSTAKWDANHDTMEIHGLIPVVYELSESQPTLIARGGKIDSEVRSFIEFATFNEGYLIDLAEIIEGISDLGSQDL